MFGSSLPPVVCRRVFVLLCVLCLSIVISNVLSYHMSLRSEFHIVMSVTISAYKRCLVRLYLQLFVEGIMSYLRYLCLFALCGVQHILPVWVTWRGSYVTNVFYCLLIFSNVYCVLERYIFYSTISLTPMIMSRIYPV